MAGEMVEFENGVKGIALNLEESSVGVMVLGDYTRIEEGNSVAATGALLRVPVGEGMIGRVVNPLGEPIDDQGPILGPRAGPSNRSHLASPVGSRSTSRFKPASSRSTP